MHKEVKELFPEAFLHGSRGMVARAFLPWEKKTLPEGTDYDYAVQHTQPWQQLVSDLTKLGWVECVDKCYLDNDTAFVFEKIINGDRVQISTRQNLNRYIDCFNSIEPDFYFKYLWKKSAHCLPVEDRRKFYNSLYYCWDR